MKYIDENWIWHDNNELECKRCNYKTTSHHLLAWHLELDHNITFG